jgi:hypothetical protein
MQVGPFQIVEAQVIYGVVEVEAIDERGDTHSGTPHEGKKSLRTEAHRHHRDKPYGTKYTTV